MGRIRLRLAARSGRRAGLSLLMLAALTLVGTAAWAYWSALGSGVAAATTGTLNAPTNVVAGTGSGVGTVRVTWTPSTGTPAPQGYYVTRTRVSDKATAPACGSSPTVLVTGACTDTGVAEGTYTYTAVAVFRSWTATSAPSDTITVRAASKLAFTTQPGGGTSQVAFATQPVVAVQDAAGNTITTDTSSVTLALTTPGGATLSCNANPTQAVSGVATFAGCKVDKAGTYTLTATDGSLASATSASFTVTPGTPSKLAFTTQPGDGTGGTALTTQPVVTVQDAYGNTVTGDTSPVTLWLTGSTRLSCTANPQAAVSGVATFAGCKVDKAGSYALTAMDGSLTPAASAGFTVSVGAAGKLAFTTQPSGGASQVAFATQPVVAVQDAGGNAITTDTSSVTLALTTPGGATLTCTANPKAAVSGVASFAGCKVDKAGTYTLTATDGSLASATSASFTVSPGMASRLAFTTQPGNGTGGTALTTQPVVAVQDTWGNTVTGDASSVTLTLTTPGGATLTCNPNPKPTVSGVATFAGCKVDKPGDYTLTATDGALTSATSTGFTVSVGAPSRLAFTTQPVGGSSRDAFATQPVVTVQDAGGNTVTTDSSPVTLALTSAPAGASLVCDSNPKAAVSGVAAFSGCLVRKAGTYTLTATDGSLASATSLSFTITAGPATTLMYTDATGLTPTCQSGTYFAGPNGSMTTWVAFWDAFGNLAVGPTTATQISITSSPGTGGGAAPSPNTLTVPANGSVTTGSSVFAMPNGNPKDTTYTASASGFTPALVTASCVVTNSKK